MICLLLSEGCTMKQSYLAASEPFFRAQSGVSDPHSDHHRREGFRRSRSWLIRGIGAHR
jgi:hypothetical protein